MGIGRWLPPGVLVVLFVGVAAVDLYRALHAPAAAGPQVLPLTAARFVPDDYVLDLRGGAAEASTTMEAAARLSLEEGWGTRAKAGRWTAAALASLRVDLPVGGQRALLAECRSDHRPGDLSRLALTVNGFRAAPTTLQQGFAVYRWVLPEGVLVAGDNRIELALLAGEAGERAASDRTLLVRRLAVAGDPRVHLSDVVRRRRVRVDAARGRLVIMAPGRLVMPFEVPRAGSFLTLRYRFRNGGAGGGCTVVVGRTYSQPDAVDIMAEERLLPRRDGSGVLRLSLGHHTGASVLWVRADRGGAAAGIVLQDPVLAVARS